MTPTKAERDEILPIGSVVHMLGIHHGSWIKMNHRNDVPVDLLVAHWAEGMTAKKRAEEMEALLRELRQNIWCMSHEECQATTKRIDRLLEDSK